MTRDGLPIESAAIAHAVRTDIEFEAKIPGCVPEYEEREAAVYCNYTPTEFRELPVWERGRAVAQYRLHKLVEVNMQDAVNRAEERMMRRKRPD